MNKSGRSCGFFYGLIIAFGCIFFQYHAYVVSYGMIFIFLFMSVYLLIYKRLRYDKSFFYLTIFLSFQEIFSAVFLGFGKTHLLTNIIYILFVFVLSGISSINVDEEQLIKCFRIVVIICGLFIYYQSIQIYIFGNEVNAIAILPLSKERMVSWNHGILQPCGLFSEPQTYCSYMAPLLAIFIENKKFKTAIFLTLSMILTGSSLGISICILLWCIPLVSREISNVKKALFIIIGFVAILLFMSGDTVFEMREKMVDIIINFSSYASGEMLNVYAYSNFLRVVKGWKTLFEMPMTDKVVGICKDSFGEYLSTGGVGFSWLDIWKVSSRNSLYFSSAAGNFIEYGLIGGSVFYCFFIKKALSESPIVRKLVVLLFFESFFTQISYNGVFIYSLIIILLFCDKDKMQVIKI